MSDKTNEIAEYVKYAAQLIDLSIAPEYLPGVIENMTRIVAVAALVNELDLPEEIEAAPVFEP
jgi:hypothetical protein